MVEPKTTWRGRVGFSLALAIGLAGCPRTSARCEGLPCGPNSVGCIAENGVDVCWCARGYTGEGCYVCDEGYQDNATPGLCRPNCATAALDCGAGACSDASGEALCNCDTGYAGDGCYLCDTGYQDNGTRGVCRPSCDTASLDCGAGTCSDAGGEALCNCDTGYAGDDCSICDTGYQENDTPGVCRPDCVTASLDCGAGTCSDTSGEALCVCDTGYAGDGCSICDAGYQDNGTPGVCAPDCVTASLDCGAGTCSDTSGEALCDCDTGYTGDDCSSCSQGYQDNGIAGVCLPDCTTAAPNCQAHATCDDADGTADCVCVTGYRTQGGLCLWDIDFVNPGFTSSGGWSLSGGVAIETTGVGQADVGRLVMSGDALCARGTFSQVVQMPSYASAEPVVLSFFTQDLDCASPPCSQYSQVRLGVGMNGGWVPLPRNPPMNQWVEQRICLGQRAYGGVIEFEFGAYSAPLAFCQSGLPDEVRPIVVDGVHLAPAGLGECPDPGAVANGDFELGLTGWQADTSSGGTVEVVAGIGANGSPGLRLGGFDTCAVAPRATGQASIPLQISGGGMAWEFWISSASQTGGAVTFDGTAIGMVAGNLTPSTARICIPSYLTGLAVSNIGFSWWGRGGAGCTPTSQEVVLDNLQIVAEPSCPGNLPFIDGGLEGAGWGPSPSPSWIHWVLGMFAGSTVFDSPTEARTGARSLRLSTSATCHLAQAGSTFEIIPPAGSSGPALKFWYRIPTLSRASPFLSIRPSYTYAVLDATTGWTQKTVCLDPVLAGRPGQVYLSFIANDPTCHTSFTEEVAWFDDFEVTTDPACPAQ